MKVQYPASWNTESIFEKSVVFFFDWSFDHELLHNFCIVYSLCLGTISKLFSKTVILKPVNKLKSEKLIIWNNSVVKSLKSTNLQLIGFFGTKNQSFARLLIQYTPLNFSHIILETVPIVCLSYLMRSLVHFDNIWLFEAGTLTLLYKKYMRCLSYQVFYYFISYQYFQSFRILRSIIRISFTPSGHTLVARR